ncbi:hypothetical protein [Nocardia neocaledoniensis]|uniref:hypothetical protein n=1 Tax=Nocardia neocaledoniensis TaxID=236511 RepID=UPI002453AD06|nr:hypothetical protein [Nocardia neocaledoniensis]
MFDLERIDTPALSLVDRVVDALVSSSGATDTSIMVIGAHCRDLLHASFGRTDLLRSTSDVDLGVAVDGDATYRRIVSIFPSSGRTEIRYSIAGVSVDVVPFGEIEDPAGTTVLPGRKDTLDVFGFREVFSHSEVLRLPSGHHVRIPTPAGYTALKLKAWCDRSINGEYKDAADISTACSWYQQDADVRAALYGQRTDLLLRTEIDVDVSALHLLGEEMAEILGSDRVAELSAAWQRTNRELLIEYFARQRSRTHPDRAAADRAITGLTAFVSE